MRVPLKELFVVAVLIWLGAFACMIPQMLTDSEAAKIAADNAERQAHNILWVSAEKSKRSVSQ